MTYEPVDIYVKDTSPLQNPLEAVVVRVFSQDGKLTYTQMATDADGHAGFLLPSGATYQLRLYKPNVSFQNPKYIEVQEAPEVNSFDIAAEMMVPPIPTDSRLCTAYGFFRTASGGPAAFVDLHFIAKFNPLLLDGSGVLTERVTTRTDARGYAEINLIRHGEYDVTVQGLDDVNRLVAVPDSSNVNLPDLLFPVVDRVLFDPDGPFSVTIGTDVQTTPIVYGTNGVLLPRGSRTDVRWSSDNPAVLLVLPAGGVLTLRGVSPGTANIIATRRDRTIVRIPNTPIQGVPMPVVVA